MKSNAKTVDEYIEASAPERAVVLVKLRELCRRHLRGYEEMMAYGGPCYAYNGEIEVGFGNQKHFLGLYILKKDVLDTYRHALKDTGKGVIRYANLQDIDYAVVEHLLKDTAASNAAICP